MRFPIQVVAKSRTKEEHLAYYRWVHFINGEEKYWHEPSFRYRTRNTFGPVIGFRTRWFHTAMDLVPTVIWRHLPVRWQSAHLFG